MKKKNSFFIKILSVLFYISLLITIVLCSVFIFMDHLGKQVTYKERQPVEYTETTLKSDVVENILIIGKDGREHVTGSRSDMMMLVSINKKEQKIVLTSFLRDCYVEIPGVGGNRLNASYAKGGADLAVRTIEKNFDIAIDHYVVVGFDVVMSAIDALGGVEISLEKEELDSGDPTKPTFNQYVNEMNMLENLPEGTDFIVVPGTYVLNGRQALSYARIRYTAGNDFARTSRQREVIMGAIQQSNISELFNAAKVALPMIETDFKSNEIADFTICALDYLTFEVKELSIPQVNNYKDATINGMAVLEIDFDKTYQLLEETIY